MKGLPPLEKASMSILLGLLLLRFVLHLHFSLYFFLFPLPYIFHFVGFTEISFLDKDVDKFIFGLRFPGLDYSCPQSSVCPPRDLDVAETCFTVIHLLGLDLFSLSTN